MIQPMTQAPTVVSAEQSDTATPALGYCAVAVPLTDVRRDPDPTSELVTQALLGTPAAALARDASSAWTRVRLPDYEGWVATAALAPEPQPTVAADPTRYARVGVATATLRVTDPGGAAQIWTVFAGTLLQLAEPLGPGAVIVHLPDGRSGVIAGAALTPLLEYQGRRGDVAAVLATARQFLTTPYLWGGMSVHGIDCSGFVQTIYRVHGYTMPRDAHMQFAALPTAVEHGAWQPGDLLFFGPSADDITHVGMFVGDTRVIHATARSSPPAVVVQSLDPAAADYSARLAGSYVGARRVVTAAPPGTAR
jgi:hypothetical protein